MLDELRQKPKNVREKYAFWGAFGITAVIAIFWGLSLSIKMNVPDTVVTEEKPVKTQPAGAFARSFSDIKSSVASAWSSLSQDSDTDDVNNEEVIEAEVDDVEATTSTSSQFEFSTTATEEKNENRRAVLIATTSIKQASSTE